MAYQIVKGWPSQGALDVKFTQTNAGEITPGLVFKVVSTGYGDLAAATNGGTDVFGFCFDYDTESMSNGLSTEIMGLFGNFVVEVDVNHTAQAISSYDVGDKLSVDAAGKFLECTGGDATKQVIGRVIGKTTTTLRILWVG